MNWGQFVWKGSWLERVQRLIKFLGCFHVVKYRLGENFLILRYILIGPGQSAADKYK